MRYLEDKELNDVLVQYFEENEDKETSINEKFLLADSLSDTKNIYKICSTAREKINQKTYKFYYITIKVENKKFEGNVLITPFSIVRLYGSDEKLSKSDFVKTGEIREQYKKSTKRLMEKTTKNISITKNDLDNDLKKYVIFEG